MVQINLVEGSFDTLFCPRAYFLLVSQFERFFCSSAFFGGLCDFDIFGGLSQFLLSFRNHSSLLVSMAIACVVLDCGLMIVAV